MSTPHISHDLARLERLLGEGRVRLVYLKKDGTMREAAGTRCPDLIPEDDHPRGLREPSARVLCYWDFDRGAWRCLLRENLLGFIDN